MGWATSFYLFQKSWGRNDQNYNQSAMPGQLLLIDFKVDRFIYIEGAVL
jgi:hypothetical protein